MSDSKMREALDLLNRNGWFGPMRPFNRETLLACEAVREALASAQQSAEPYGTVTEWPCGTAIMRKGALLRVGEGPEGSVTSYIYKWSPPAAPVAPEEQWKVVDRLLCKAYQAGMDGDEFDMLAAKRALLATPSPAPEQREEVELTDERAAFWAWWTTVSYINQTTAWAAWQARAAHEAKQSGGV